MGLACSQCTPKCTFDLMKVNFDYKVESVPKDEDYRPYKRAYGLNGSNSWNGATKSVDNSISFTKADLTPINAGGASGCPSSFTTQIFTSPHSLDNADFEIESSDMWDLRLRWDFPSDGGYRHPILVGLLLVGSDDVIYASKLVYFTRDPTGSN